MMTLDQLASFTRETTRSEYRKARRLVRDNGLYALRWLAPQTAAIFSALAAGHDELKERQRYGAGLYGVEQRVRKARALYDVEQAARLAAK
jgi:hypothetical protein